VAPALFLGAPVSADPKVLSLLGPDFARAKAIKSRPIGVRALTAFSRSYESRESSIGNFTVDSLRKAMKDDLIAVNNVNGIRAGLPAGDLTYGDVYEVMPFDNQTAIVKVTGKQLIRLVTLGHRGTGLVWSGLTFGASKCDITSVEVNGQPVNPDAEYTLATSDFLATGESVFADAGIKPEQARVLEEPQYVLLETTLRGMIAAGNVADPLSYFDPNNPRQRVTGQCTQSQLIGEQLLKRKKRSAKP
jgi:2',3'-cyclic-nucleotide 2'-phosphodiesterase (5'-nucleotidase family)